ncbi:hypothetical protein L9F63_005771, partial [Diploptera punctata]
RNTWHKTACLWKQHHTSFFTSFVTFSMLEETRVCVGVKKYEFTLKKSSKQLTCFPISYITKKFFPK